VQAHQWRRSTKDVQQTSRILREELSAGSEHIHGYQWRTRTGGALGLTWVFLDGRTTEEFG